MELWTTWMHILESVLWFLTMHFGFSEAASIIILTLLARAAMMPLSLSAAYKAQTNKEKIERIKPTLEKLRNKFKDNPHELATRTMALYREKGIKFIDKKTILNIVAQSIFGLGMFKVLRRIEFRSKFLWIADLGKPDFLLTILVGILMAVSMVLMPESTGHASMWLMIAVPVLISVIAVATLPSAIGIYWATSNVVTIGQTLALRGLISRRQRIQNTSNEKSSKK